MIVDSMTLKELHRERYDYSTFLRKFCVLGEEIMITRKYVSELKRALKEG